MGSLEHGAAVAQIPRFDDGVVNVQELLRVMAETRVNEIMDAQTGDARADGNRRSGYRERALVTGVGGPSTCASPNSDGAAASRRTSSCATRARTVGGARTFFRASGG